jgi:hypothetical protein
LTSLLGTLTSLLDRSTGHGNRTWCWEVSTCFAGPKCDLRLWNSVRSVRWVWYASSLRSKHNLLLPVKKGPWCHSQLLLFSLL